MKKLMVSYDCGSSYYPIARADNVSDFEEKIKELESDYLRYYIEDENGNIDEEHICSIHRGIVETINLLQKG